MKFLVQYRLNYGYTFVVYIFQCLTCLHDNLESKFTMHLKGVGFYNG